MQKLIATFLTLMTSSLVTCSDDVTRALMSENPIAWAMGELTNLARYELSMYESGRDGEVVAHSAGSDLSAVAGSDRRSKAAAKRKPMAPVMADAAKPEVRTGQGVVLGRTLERSHAFYSVPYAQAPVGQLRFKDPVELSEDATTTQVSDRSEPDYRLCHQLTDDCEEYPCTMSEDCLVMNIHVPSSVDLSSASSPPAALLPVMVWIHGGFFFRGAGTDPNSDGEQLASAAGAVVVGLNYRVGPFGFMAIKDEESGERYFNQGLKDQQAALRWIAKNIGKFGGDMNQVTLFGESAGAQSVMFHLLSPRSDPLFHRAIMQSNPAAFPYEPFDTSLTTTTQRTLQALNCTDGDYSCLWEADAESILATRNRIMVGSLLSGEMFNGIEPYRPCIDGEELTDGPFELFGRGQWQTHKPMVVGTNRDEMSYVDRTLGPILSLPKKLFEILNRIVVGEEYVDAIVDKYSSMATGRPPRNYVDALGQEVTDMIFLCPNRKLARLAAETTKSEVYVYVNGHTLDDPGCSEAFSFNLMCNTSFHSSEIPLVFGNDRGYNMTFSRDDVVMTTMFASYWASFANTGSPTPSVTQSSFTDWPKYRTGAWEMMWLTSSSEHVTGEWRDDFCDLWDSTDFYLKQNDSHVVTTTAAAETTTTEATTTTSTTTATIVTEPPIVTTPHQAVTDDYDYDGGAGGAFSPRGGAAGVLVAVAATLLSVLLA